MTQLSSGSKASVRSVPTSTTQGNPSVIYSLIDHQTLLTECMRVVLSSVSLALTCLSLFMSMSSSITVPGLSKRRSILEYFN